MRDPLPKNASGKISLPRWRNNLHVFWLFHFLAFVFLAPHFYLQSLPEGWDFTVAFAIYVAGVFLMNGIVYLILKTRNPPCLAEEGDY